ncbi:MAG: hypothetical protein FD149_1111 [Rhodospirillaceae bacterium]|nr:MAG: hypothetical protein FD149_1111 [Rhodospirillaceae bacterium]
MLFPSLEGGDPVSDSKQAAEVSAAEEALPLALGSSTFEPPVVTPGRTTGSFVGRKVTIYREELRGLQGAIRQRNGGLQTLRNEVARKAIAYHENVASIHYRLQIGTTPGNPILNQKWSQAQRQLNDVSNDLIRMNQLANDVAADSSMAAYLLDSVRAAFSLQGAIEEDHRQLRILEDETHQTVVLIERLLSEISTDITRQQQYIANEKGNLNILAMGIQNGQLYGVSLANRMMQLTPQTSPPASRGGAATAPANVSQDTLLPGERPLVVIRFDRPNVAYEQPLYQAINRALDRRPSAVFELVAVAPTSGGAAQAAVGANTARRHAEQVLRSLGNMGLPTDRVHLSATNSPNATSSEVHVYVR